jgi:hypothetical protein
MGVYLPLFMAAASGVATFKYYARAFFCAFDLLRIAQKKLKKIFAIL